MQNDYRFNGQAHGDNYHAIVCWQEFNYSWWVEITRFNKAGEITSKLERTVPDHVRRADGSIKVDGPHRLKEPRKVATTVARYPDNF